MRTAAARQEVGENFPGVSGETKNFFFGEKKQETRVSWGARPQRAKSFCFFFFRKRRT
jgi:hypothetical protein